jgi:hypothetical protein
MESTNPEIETIYEHHATDALGADINGRVLYSHFGIECYRTHAMKSVCAFAVFMFLTYIGLVGLLFKYKNDILGASPLDEDLPALPSLGALMGRSDPAADADNEVGTGSNYPQSADL